MKKTKKFGVVVFALAFLIAAFGVSAYTVPLTPGHAVTVQAATLGKQNALSKAKVYLSTMPFSKSGLIKQLKFDGFTTKQAKYGVKKAGY